MTATASIVTASRDNALLVPNAALRFAPPSAAAKAPSRGLVAKLLPRPPPAAPKTRPAATKRCSSRIWLLSNMSQQAVAVRAGVSNGRYTEVLAGELTAGMAVITDYQEAKK